MHKTCLWLLILGLLLGACTTESPTEVPAPTSPPLPTATRTPPPTATQVPEPTQTAEPVVAAFEGMPLPIFRQALFSGSGACAVCHTNMSNSAGIDVSTDAYWRSTMMANSSRDPYWRASVQAEILRNPELGDVIEAKCAQCHTPMATVTALSQEEPVSLIGEGGLLDPDHPLHPLAADGVSCTVCHQILPDNLGQPESFSGGFLIDLETPEGERSIFGPFNAPPGPAAVMQSASGYAPVQSPHIKEAALCATCHTLYTPTIGPGGEILGEFPEQTAFLEWSSSDYVDFLPCQGCHMPEIQGGVRLSVTGGPVRSPVRQHNFVGGNVNMLTIFKRFGEELSITASSDHFEATIERTLTQLQNDTASIKLQEADLSGTTLLAEVSIQNQVGHKFPTGFPSRRAWVRLTVVDASGEILFSSGDVAEDGSILGNDNDLDPATFERHYDTIVSTDQVQIYESIIRDAAGQVSTELMRAASYVKDNRLLPAGFDKEDVEADIAVRGEARGDENFLGGGDQLQYVIKLADAQGPFTVRVELLYQAIGFRWIENLGAFEGEAIAAMQQYYQASPSSPVVISSQEVQVEP